MGAYYSKTKPDLFVVMIKGSIEACAMGVYSSLDTAMDFVPTLGNSHPVWIEKFRLDDPSYYEDQDEYIVWSSDKNVAFN